MIVSRVKLHMCQVYIAEAAQCESRECRRAYLPTVLRLLDSFCWAQTANNSGFHCKCLKSACMSCCRGWVLLQRLLEAVPAAGVHVFHHLLTAV
jgi:hypothetical protein